MVLDTPLDDYDYETSTIPTARRNSGTRGGQSSRRTSSGQRRTSSGRRRPEREDRSRRQLTPLRKSAGDVCCQEKSSEEEKEKKSTASYRYFSCDSCDRWIDHVSVFVSMVM